MLDKAESKLYEVTQGNIKRSSETAQSLVLQAKKRIEEIVALGQKRMILMIGDTDGYAEKGVRLCY